MSQDHLHTTRISYDAVSAAYAAHFSDELDSRPIERGLLEAFTQESKRLDGRVVDLGCGPGHVTNFLANREIDISGLDLSHSMVLEARRRFPGLTFLQGSLTSLGLADASCSGAIALYSIIHLPPEDRARAFREAARILRADSPLLISFHVSIPEHPTGAELQTSSWFDIPVSLTGYMLAPDVVAGELATAGFEILVRLERQPLSPNELPSLRCYLLARRS